MVIEVMIQKYLQAQSLVWVFVVVGILQNIINVLVAALFIYVGDIVIVWVIKFNCMHPLQYKFPPYQCMGNIQCKYMTL